MDYVVGVDIGGTCTDTVVLGRDGTITLAKAFSTPPDFSDGIVDSLTVAARQIGVSLAELLAGTSLFLHSTTVAENAVTDGDLSKVGLLTTAGFEDTLFITRGAYGRWSGLTEDEKRDPVFSDKPAPLVARSLVRGVKERTDAHGTALLLADPAEIEAAVKDLTDRGVGSFGICFLWSFMNSENERQAAEIIRNLCPDKFVTASHEVAPVIGEYERTSTVVLNSAVGPVVQNYLNRLESKLKGAGFRGTLLVAQAYGGLLPVDLAVGRPVGMIESGPVSGVVGAKSLGERMGFSNIIAADMGGTTFKVGVVREGQIEYQHETMVYRYHFALPKMDIVSLGLAGGSIISIDRRTGVPHIGPRSAGAYPGPICYDNGGTEPTVTDVDALLGYLNPRYFLGGREGLTIEKVAPIFKEKVADPLGMSVAEAAAGVYKLANSRIYDLLHKVTIERGLNPQKFALFSFGGTAGMHAAAYGSDLGVSHIVIPHSASVHSAFGLVTSDIVHEDRTTLVMRMPVDPEEVNRVFDDLTERVTAELRREGFDGKDILIQRSVDMRYRRQVHLINVPVEWSGPLNAAGLERTVAAFEALYEGKYGQDSAFREAGMEMVAFHVRGTGLTKKPEFKMADLSGKDPTPALVERRQAYVWKTNAMEQVSGYDFERLRPGNEVPGPAIIWTPITTVVTNPDQVALVDPYKNLVITRR